MRILRLGPYVCHLRGYESTKMPKREVLTSLVLLRMSEQIGVASTHQAGLHDFGAVLGFENTAIQVVIVRHSAVQNPGAASLDLLHKWVDANGSSEKFALKLHEILLKNGYTKAAKVLGNELFPEPSTDNPTDCTDGIQAAVAVHPEDQALQDRLHRLQQPNLPDLPKPETEQPVAVADKTQGENRPKTAEPGKAARSEGQTQKGAGGSEELTSKGTTSSEGQTPAGTTSSEGQTPKGAASSGGHTHGGHAHDESAPVSTRDRIITLITTIIVAILGITYIQYRDFS
ncbi:uncharacterized protein [Diadema antillarum]|uniref:uncharacterized protein isoform X1 n=1 Tax=Diadema antillarum TaxID=105358 RepID=UPI003A889C71